MNDTFMTLPVEKQDNIINAGYKTFGRCSYRQASMALIAEEAQISKALLFYYFKNKKELYFYLFQTAVNYLNKAVSKKEIIYGADFFEMIEETCRQRIFMMEQYPYIFRFVASVYYEQDEKVKEELTELKAGMMQVKKETVLEQIDRTKFRYPEDVELLYDIVINFSEGYMEKNLETLYHDPSKVLQDALNMSNLLQRNVYRNDN
jgi:AcrR family transcriptional regulator